ncbi:hypothetical protein LWC35_18060 [Pseudonocardia kujensis]|uniref:hypothetical protein n=1 Tax=Pseudonocardia kujensis TaxID=1128675 RepID=UPI001E2C9655|nr:hypothetical protein [Pseudonocardia kujensis]MCE0764798.1 hypothetical protein [Pseudonocardia kujensis]
MLSLGTLTLLRHPDQAAQVRDGDPATVAPAVEELLRLLTVVHTGRRRVAREDVELAGVRIRAGEGVIHQCLGQPLARLEMRIAYPALLRRFPGLAVASPIEETAFRDERVVHGVEALPVTW